MGRDACTRPTLLSSLLRGRVRVVDHVGAVARDLVVRRTQKRERAARLPDPLGAAHRIRLEVFLARADPSVALAVGFSLFVAVVLASTSGVLIPVFFKRIGFDPAIASGPLVTTLNDLFGILAYFGLATALLGTVGR